MKDKTEDREQRWRKNGVNMTKWGLDKTKSARDEYNLVVGGGGSRREKPYHEGEKADQGEICNGLGFIYRFIEGGVFDIFFHAFVY